MPHIHQSEYRSQSVTTRVLKDGSVTSAKLAPGAVGNANLGAGSVGFTQIQAGVLKQVVIPITNAEMLAIRATPKALVAAPGAGKVLEFISCVLSSLASGGAYTETTDNLAVRYTNGSGALASSFIETTGVIDQTTQTYSMAPAIACIPVPNAALVLHNTGDGEFGGGNAANTMKLLVTYRELTLP